MDIRIRQAEIASVYTSAATPGSVVPACLSNACCGHVLQWLHGHCCCYKLTVQLIGSRKFRTSTVATWSRMNSRGASRSNGSATWSAHLSIRRLRAYGLSCFYCHYQGHSEYLTQDYHCHHLLVGLLCLTATDIREDCTRWLYLFRSLFAPFVFNWVAM